MKKAVQNIDKTLYVRVGVCMQAFVYKSCTCVCVCVCALPGVPQPAEREMRRHYSVPALQCVTVCVHVYTRRISSSLHQVGTRAAFTHPSLLSVTSSHLSPSHSACW